VAVNPVPIVLDSSQRKLSDRVGERGFLYVTLAAALLAVGVLVAIAVKVFDLAAPAMGEFGAGFLTSHDWNAVTGKFGALDFIYGTAVSSLVALAIAAPISIAIALFLTPAVPRS
jgi:phosphate transport system permease protein